MSRKQGIFIVLLSLLLLGCAIVDYDIVAVKPNEYGIDESFSNKIYQIYCNGDSVADLKLVCKIYMSKFAAGKGYDYFTVLNQDEYERQSVGSYTTNKAVTTYKNTYSYGSYKSETTTTYVPQTHFYNVTKYSKSVLFILIEKDEINKWNNYYKVSDYYIPKQEKSPFEM